MTWADVELAVLGFCYEHHAQIEHFCKVVMLVLFTNKKCHANHCAAILATNELVSEQVAVTFRKCLTNLL